MSGIVLIVFVFLYSGIFTKEYETNTLILILTKGLSRYKVVFAKFFVMFTMWTIIWIVEGIPTSRLRSALAVVPKPEPTAVRPATVAP